MILPLCGSSRAVDEGHRSYPSAQASLVIAMIIPISTNTTIAACSQIQVGDMDRQAYRRDVIRRCGTAL
jgi:hypothetical protein